jgi:TIR domain
MGRIEKTVFISYRRTDQGWGQAIFGDLTQHGYDVFIDYDGIASGSFETVILENIKARAHFLVVLTPTALEPRGASVNWMLREIEAAVDSQRNIVPLMLEGFDFGKAATAGHLTGKLAALKKYNGLPVPAGYFPAAMERLRSKFLNVPVDAVLHPASDSAQQVAKEQKGKAAIALEDEQLRRVQEPDNVIQGKDTEINELQIKLERTEKNSEVQRSYWRWSSGSQSCGRHRSRSACARCATSRSGGERNVARGKRSFCAATQFQSFAALLRRRSSPSVTGVA